MGHRTTHNRTHRTTRRSALRGHTLSSREERVWRKTRQRTHGSLETPSLCGLRLRLDESIPDEFASVPSPNSNQRRCSRALSDLLTEEQGRSTPWKLMSGKAFSSTGSPPLRAYCTLREACGYRLKTQAGKSHRCRTPLSKSEILTPPLSGEAWEGESF